MVVIIFECHHFLVSLELEDKSLIALLKKYQLFWTKYTPEAFLMI